MRIEKEPRVFFYGDLLLPGLPFFAVTSLIYKKAEEAAKEVRVPWHYLKPLRHAHAGRQHERADAGRAKGVRLKQAKAG
jgi:hypothetical protein